MILVWIIELIRSIKQWNHQRLRNRRLKKLINKYRGKNLGFDLFKKSIDIVFDEDNVIKIYSYNNDRNRNSNRLWNKLSENGYIVNKDENFYSVERG